MEHFNRLTPAEAERLALLSEECGEVVKAIGKIFRHGYDSHNPEDPKHQGNRLDLAMECGHVQAAIDLLCIEDDLYSAAVKRSRADKAINVKRYLHHG